MSNYLIHTDLHLGHSKCLEFEPTRTSFEDIINDDMYDDRSWRPFELGDFL